jgi:hypothetical protein
VTEEARESDCLPIYRKNDLISILENRMRNTNFHKGIPRLDPGGGREGLISGENFFAISD